MMGNAIITGLEEHVYDASGTPQSNTYSYSLGGHVLGQSNGTTSQFYLTDAQASVLSTFSTIAGSALILGSQVYGPYGNQRYSVGSMGTTKGYTGQYADATGLDYYNARYYDPVVGRFISADVKQGNAQGMDPYEYVAGNPETLTDPTGQRFISSTGVVAPLGSLVSPTNDWNSPTSQGGGAVSPPPHAPGHGFHSSGTGRSTSQSSGKGGNKRSTPVCELMCGKLDGWRLAGGIGELIAGGLLIGGLIAVTGAAGAATGGALALLIANYVKGGILQGVHYILAGLQDIFDSAEEHGRQIDVVFDVLKIVVDVLIIVATAIDITKFIAKSGGVGITLFQKSAFLLKEAGNFFTKKPTFFQNSPGKILTVMTGFGGIIGAFAGDLVPDFNQLRGDLDSCACYKTQ